ncbi:acyltransferase family protein [Arthrobacter luteolus]|uniref:acyltransferase family protein n=1 Tax=Arthrobacter luteolus TaxID=98672 RepID=UPI0009F99562|nr:acyltransferase family protein [Arthrobacter luteolus]
MPPLTLSAPPLPSAHPASASHPAPAAGKVRLHAGHRRDIQGLRAMAVALVVWYHIWPQSLPGGFVGVDVFFVISGYLIIGSLAREITSTGRLALARFYSRRIKRLLPAAATVLLATLAATVLLFPEGRWQSIARDAAAAGLNVQNWNQAFSASSYEGATASVSPLQHYWSLAVEEQFYLVIPLVMLFCAGIVRKTGGGRALRHTLIVALGVLTVASLLHSVQFSAAAPDLAYFFTTTRIWELSLGGLLAVTVPQLRFGTIPRAILGWAGLGMVLAAAVTFSTAMAFPGWAALLPVAGTLALLASGSSQGPRGYAGPARWYSLRPVTYVGDISYSLYLWHWPVIVFSVYLLGTSPDWLYGSALIAGSVALAALSTRFVERPFRVLDPARFRRRIRNRARGRRRAATPEYRSVFVLGALLTVVPLALAAVPYLIVEEKVQALNAELDLSSYPGAMANYGSPVPPPNMPVRPDPAVAGADQPHVPDECRTGYNPAEVDYQDCVFGDTASSRSIVLVGDSHAAQYMDSLGILARESGHRLYVLARNGCPFSTHPLASDTFTYTNCSGQNEQTIQDILAIKPALVVTAALSPAGYEEALGWRWKDDADAVGGFVGALAPLNDAGIPVAVISDLPYPPFNVPECVAKGREDSCAFDRPQTTSPLADAADAIDGATVVDLKDYLCPDGVCQGVIGNVLVYRDNHITGTFAKTLALPLQDSLGL